METLIQEMKLSITQNLSNSNDAYILGRGDITVVADPTTVSKISAQFIKCITKIDGTTIYCAEDLDLVMTICNLLE